MTDVVIRRLVAMSLLVTWHLNGGSNGGIRVVSDQRNDKGKWRYALPFAVWLGIHIRKSHKGRSTDLPGLEQWQMMRCRHSSSGFHVAIGDVAPQITVVVGHGQVCGGQWWLFRGCGGHAVVWIIAVVLCCGCVVVMVNRVGWEEGGRGYLLLCKHKQKLWMTTLLLFIIWHLPFPCVNVGQHWWHGVAMSLLLWWLWGNRCGRQWPLA